MGRGIGFNSAPPFDVINSVVIKSSADKIIARMSNYAPNPTQ